MAAKLDDNAILALVLKEMASPRHAIRVAAMTDPSHLLDHDRRSQRKAREYILRAFKQKGYDVALLYDQLLKKNRTPVKLTLASSPKDGYEVVKDDKGFGVTRVSLPAYDPKTGLVMLYAGSVAGPMMGSGDLYLYKFDGKQTEKLHSVPLWIS